MSQLGICGWHIGFIAFLAILLNVLDRTLASLDGYVPGQDYPVYIEVPEGLSFTCADKIPGYYADPETQCQVWHWCVAGLGGNIMYSFICTPGTVFNQRTRVCDWFFNVDCPSAQAYYGVNEDLYKDEEGNYIAGKKKHSYDTKHDQRRLTARSKRQHFAKTNDKKRVNRQTQRHRKHSTTTSTSSPLSRTLNSISFTYEPSSSTYSTSSSTYSPSSSTSSPSNSTYKPISSIFSNVREIDF